MSRIFRNGVFYKVIFAGILIGTTGFLNAKDFKLWGKQIAGWGHSNNARTEGNQITLPTPAKIISVHGNATGVNGFCFWSQTKSTNRAILCGGTDRKHSIIGRVLPPDTYTVFPRVGKYVNVRLRSVKNNLPTTPTTPIARINKRLWGTQKAGWGHAVNARVTGNSITLNAPARIFKVTGNATGAKGFCLWTNRHAILCGGTNRANSIVGSILQPGTYTVLPRAGTSVTISF